MSRLLAEDANHTSSRRWLERHLTAGGQVVAPILLLAEVGGAPARRSDDPAVGQRGVRDIVQLPGVRLVNLRQQLGARAAQLATDLRLRGADAVYVAVAESLNLPLITWDREQLARAVGRIAVRTP